MQNQKYNALPKTLVLVHPGSLCGSADWRFGRDARQYRNAIAQQILEHDGNFVVIDGFLTDEIYRSFDDVIETGLSNAVQAASRTGCLNSVSAVRLYGCDTGEPAFEEWEDCSAHCLSDDFTGQAHAAEFLSDQLKTSAIEVTGAWATLDGSSGCVNNVAAVLRSQMPHVNVRISQTALFEEYEDGALPDDPVFNRLA